MGEKNKSLFLIAGAVVLAAVFIMSGAGKVIDPAKWIGKFAARGLPEWFVPVSGALELAGAVGLLIPALRGVAGLALALFMVGAVTTHVFHAENGMTFIASTILIGSAAVGWFRLPETTAFLRRRAAAEGSY
jgi:uncharacterized membrane protein YphA (DoxX/SURF4 family)